MYIGHELQVSKSGYRIIDDISSSFNGSTTSFALTVGGSAPVPFPINTQQIYISVNGVLQEPDPTGSAGFKLLGTNIVFSSAPSSGHAFFGVILAGADYVTVGTEFPAGSATSPSITFGTDNNTGLYSVTSGTMGFTADGVQTFTLDGNGFNCPDNKALNIGTGIDLIIKSDGSTSLLQSQDLRLKNKAGNENYITCSADNEVTLFFNNTARFSTTNTGTNTVGIHVDDGATHDGDVTFTGASANVIWDKSADDLIFTDNSKAFFGTSSDGLEIFHDGSNSFIRDSGTGSLILRTNDFNVQNAAGTETMIWGDDDAAVKLFYNGTARLETLSVGAQVIGSLGINTNSPTTFNANADELVLHNGSGTCGMTISCPNDSIGRICFGDPQDNNIGEIKYEHSSNSLHFVTNTAERMRIQSGGQLTVGHSASEAMYYTGLIQVQGTNSSTSAITVKTNQNDSGGPAIVLGKSRGSLGGTTVLQNGDELGTIYFAGADGTDTNSYGAGIRCQLDGTPGSNDMPGRLTFLTTADGAASSTERMRITSTGRVLIGTTIDSNNPGGFYNKLQVEGTSADSSSISITRNSNDNNPPYVNFGKSRGTSVNSNTIVADNDDLGRITWTGADGSGTFNTFAYISTCVDGTPGNTDAPGRLTIWTTPDGSATPVERLRIDSEGHVIIAESMASNRPRIVLSAPDDGTNYRHLFGANLQVDDSDTFTTPSANISGGGWEYLSANSLNAHGEVRYLSAPDTNATSSTPLERLRITSAGEVVINDTSAVASALFGIKVNPSTHNGIGFKPTANGSFGALRTLNAAGSEVCNIQYDTTNANINFRTSNAAKATITSAGRVLIGTGAVGSATNFVGEGGLQVSTNGASGAPTVCFGADGTSANTQSITNNTIKDFRMGFPNYATTEEPLAVMCGFVGDGSDTDSNGARLYIGGGTSYLNSVNHIRFYTTTNLTTLTGTERMRIDSGGRLGVGLTPHTSDVATNVTEGLIQTDGNIDIRYAGNNTDPAGARYLNFINTDTTLVAGQPMGGLHWIGNDSSNADTITASITADCAGNSGAASHILFKTGGTERFRIEDDGKCGVGVSSPAHKLHVEDSVSNVIVAKQTTNNGGYNTFAGVDSFGNVKFYATHNGRVGAAGGIIFGSDTATANVLDDYEEGSWTSNITYSTSTTGLNITESMGKYIKIGHLIHCTALISWDEGSSSGNVEITGLPYTIKNDSAVRAGGHAIYLDGFSGLEDSNIVCYQTGNVTTIGLYRVGATNDSQLGASATRITESNTSSSNTTRFMFHYTTA